MMDTSMYSATLGFKRATRPQSTGTMSLPGPDEESRTRARPKAPPTTVASNGATLTPVVNENDVDSPDVLIVRGTRRTYWFNGPIATLPKREPYITPSLLSLADEDE